MIFSSLFKKKPTWQHKNSTVRITAINDELSPDDSEQLLILTELSKDDSSDLVRRAALIKLANFDYYFAASIDNSQVRVKQFAAKQVHDILATDHKLVLSKEEKHRILTVHSQKQLLSLSLLDAWFAHEQDSELMIALYQQISARKTSTHLLSHVFYQKQNADFQLFILKQVTDIKTLEKLSKKACNEAISQQIQGKLAALQEAIEKPKKLTKQLQLILAKLQALKDESDYGVYKKRKTVLIHDWQVFESEMGIFSADALTVLTDKYQGILAHLDKLFIAKAENYQQQIIADKLTHDKQQDKKDFTQQLNHISQALTTAVFSNDVLDETLFKEQLSTLTNDIVASVLNKAEQQNFIQQVNQFSQRLSQIPEIAECVSQASHLIAKISQLALPTSLAELNDRQQTYQAWLKTWRTIEIKTAGILPSSITQAKKQIVSTWQAGLKLLQSEQKELFFQHKKKLQDIKRLLNNGKYKVCFGLFKSVQVSFERLSSQQQQQLQRDFDTVSEKMVELSDWEHYIATPRKQELLLAMQALVDSPLDNPNDQAEKVKTYRNTWNSLGHADVDIDKQLNEQFNTLCEQAFAPCRLFYAEQDKLRAQHLVQRQQILTQVEKLSSDLNRALAEESQQTVDYKNLEIQLHRLQQQWQNAGDIDRNQYKKLQMQFKSLILPVKEAINAFHQGNISEKQLLIEQVKQLLNSDDVLAAIESAKALQKKWRAVGFAGNHQENQLWQKFRAVNDELFAKRQQLKSAQQVAQSKQQQDFEAQLAEIEQTFNSMSEQDNQLTKTVKQQASQLLERVIATKPVIKVVVTRVEHFIKLLDNTLVKQEHSKKKQSWLSLFELCSLQAEQASNLDELKALTQYQQLTTFWKKRFQEQLKISTQVQGDRRLDKTLEIEIIAQVESPKELAGQRLKIQVQLMQTQMLSGHDLDLDKQFVEWLMLGYFSKDDLPLINRLQQVYCS